MTDRQKFRLYLPAWGACARANGWRMVKGRLVGRGLEDAPGGGAELVSVIAAARQIAAARHRAAMPDDIRHGCHVVALGRDRSSGDLSNAEVDRVVSLFRVLTDPDDLDARLAWDNPGLAEARRVEWFLGQAAPEYVARLARDIYGTERWQSLPVEKQRRLSRLVGKRSPSKAPPSFAPAPVLQPHGSPPATLFSFSHASPTRRKPKC